MRSCTAILSFLFILVIGTTSVRAQTTSTAVPTSNDWMISVLTFGPGAEIFERYGHCAIRLRNDFRGIDVCYDWGNFSFQDPNFIGRFVSGQLRYWMEGKRTDEVLDDYLSAKRSITEQALNLTPRQVAKLVQVIRDQDDEAHRYYAYDYFRDNCSTRVRDMIDQVTDGAVRRSLSDPVPRTYRWQNRRVSPVGATNSLLCVLMDFVLGPRVDQPLTQWSNAFIPTVLADELDHVQLSGDGGDRPLVSKRIAIYTTAAPENFDPIAPARLALQTLPAGLIGGLLLLGCARYFRFGFYFLATLWSIFAGAGGTLIALLWAFTGHWPVAWNENLLQFTPFSVVIAVAIWHRHTRPAARILGVAVAGLSAVGVLVTISHLTLQKNAPAVCLAFPLHLSVLLGLRPLARRQDKNKGDLVSLDAPLSQGIPT